MDAMWPKHALNNVVALKFARKRERENVRETTRLGLYKDKTKQRTTSKNSVRIVWSNVACKANSRDLKISVVSRTENSCGRNIYRTSSYCYSYCCICCWNSVRNKEFIWIWTHICFYFVCYGRVHILNVFKKSKNLTILSVLGTYLCI